MRALTFICPTSPRGESRTSRSATPPERRSRSTRIRAPYSALPSPIYLGQLWRQYSFATALERAYQFARQLSARPSTCLCPGYVRPRVIGSASMSRPRRAGAALALNRVTHTAVLHPHVAGEWSKPSRAESLHAPRSILPTSLSVGSALRVARSGVSKKLASLARAVARSPIVQCSLLAASSMEHRRSECCWEQAQACCGCSPPSHQRYAHPAVFRHAEQRTVFRRLCKSGFSK